MNDLDTLDRHGPDPTPLSDHALAAARAHLASAITAPAAARRRRLPLLAAAAAAAIGLAFAPALLGSNDSIALASVDPLTFPLTATWLPPGIGDPVFSRDTGRLQFARYGPPGDDNISITAAHDAGQWEHRQDERAVDVSGQPGTIFTQQDGEVSDVTITWEQADGDLVGVTGRGKYADPELLERIADAVTDRAQQVALFLTIAPQGWPVMGYQSDHHISYGKRGELMVVLTSTQAGGPNDWGTDWRDVTIEGRPARLGRQGDDDGTRAWAVLATAPDGQEFFLRAPSSLTESQVIEIAAGVRHR